MDNTRRSRVGRTVASHIAAAGPGCSSGDDAGKVVASSGAGASGRSSAGSEAAAGGSSGRSAGGTGGTAGTSAVSGANGGGRGGSSAVTRDGGASPPPVDGSTGSEASCEPEATPPPGKSGMFPLDELVGGDYMGFAGGLYPNSNVPPCAHRAAAIAATHAIEPRAADGTPSPDGKIVLISIGLSNTTQEFCTQQTWIMGSPCAPYSFIGQAAADNEVDHDKLVIVDGAYPSQVAESWADPANSQFAINYDRVDMRLTAAGVTAQQVQAIWLKVADATPMKGLPDQAADAYRLEGFLGEILRVFGTRYPNAKLVFGASRIYGGYASTNLNPEPYAYESGFAVKWAIEAQIKQIADGTVDPDAGDLDYRNGTAPWYGWGPYLWANGTTPRESDGLVWNMEDFDPGDGTHPAMSGRQKVAAMLLGYFKSSPFTRCWFRADHPACE